MGDLVEGKGRESCEFSLGVHSLNGNRPGRHANAVMAISTTVRATVTGCREGCAAPDALSNHRFTG